MEIKKTKKKRGNYKKREPLYFYIDINGKTYRYTCENKNFIHTLKFKCSNTKCPAVYSKNKDINKNHIEYEQYSYIIPEYIKEKYNKKKFEEKDFYIDGKFNNKILGLYFKNCFFR